MEYDEPERPSSVVHVYISHHPTCRLVRKGPNKEALIVKKEVETNNDASLV